MKRLKVMTIVGTRPEIIKLSRVIAELEQHTEHVLIHSGQNFDFELNDVFFRDLEIRKPDYFLEAVGESVAESIGLIIAKADKVMEKEQPDAVLIYGDTNTGLAVIPAKRRKIPVFHMEAGNRCFDQRVPEEINRKVLDHLSDINMPLTEHARRYLLTEGIRPETIIKTGSSMQEVLSHCMPSILNSDVLTRLKLAEKAYILVSAHREENVDSEDKLSDLLDSLNAVAKTYSKQIIVSTHPRTRLRLDVLADKGKFRMDQRIEFLKPFGFMDYIHLQMHAFCVLSDSGTITEESSILDFPAVMIREAHERPEGMDEGVLIMSGLKRERILQAIATVTAQAENDERVFHPVADYQTDNVSKKVVRIILSYVDYINRTVWHR